LVLAVSLLLLATILELVRRGKLREEYSLLLLLISIIIFFLAIFSEVLGNTADFLDVAYDPSLLVGGAFVVTFVVQITQGVIISSLSLRSRDLAQKVAELEWQIGQLHNYATILEEQQNTDNPAWVKRLREMVVLAEESEKEP
jgi:uncharacterized membrane protein (DUF106 family)